MEPIIQRTGAVRKHGREKLVRLLRVGATALLITGSLSAAALAQNDQTPIPSSVTGTVSVPMASTLPAMAAAPAPAEVHVQLVDVTLQPSPVTVIGQQVIAKPGPGPIPFEIDFDPAGIDPTHTYAIQADVSAGGEVIFASTMPNLVLTMGNPVKIDVALSPVSENRPGVVTGTVAYMERIALPPTAVIRVRLVDVSQPDIARVTVGQQVIHNPGQVPVPFVIRFDPASLHPLHTYAVAADIWSGANLMFTSLGQDLVLTQGNPSDVEVLVKTVNSGSLDIVAGTVMNDGGTPPPSNAVIHVQLMDLGVANGPSHPIALPPLGEEYLTDVGQLPVPFAIHYSPVLIDPTHAYSVVADISVDGKVVFETTTSFPVITQNNPAIVSVIVEPAG